MVDAQSLRTRAATSRPCSRSISSATTCSQSGSRRLWPRPYNPRGIASDPSSSVTDHFRAIMNPPTFYQAYMVIPMDHPSIVSRRRLWQFLSCAFLFFVALYLLHLGNYGFHNRLLHSPVST